MTEIDYRKVLIDEPFAVIAKKTPVQDQENMCLLLSHKVAQANRSIENIGRLLYDKAKALLSEGGGRKINELE